MFANETLSVIAYDYTQGTFEVQEFSIRHFDSVTYNPGAGVLAKLSLPTVCADLQRESGCPASVLVS